MADAKRDGNFVPTLIGVSSVDGSTPINVYVDPTTHRLKVDLGGAGSGTVQTISIASANGFAGTSDGNASNPTLTISTTVTGILQGNGTAISAASTTGSGNVVLATGPTLSAPVLGTPASVTLTNGTGLPLSTGVTGQLPLANGGTGANLVDPNADRILFWDDSAGAVTWLTVGSGLTITDTTITASAGSGDVTGPASSTDNAIVRFDGTTGKVIQNYTSGAPTISDTGAITATQGGSLTGTWTDLGSVTTIDINGGTIDGVTIGGAVAGNITGTTITANTGFMPDANDGAYLGQAGTAFADLFLATGGVINWNSGDMVLSHSAGILTISNTATGATGPILEIYQDSATPAAADVIGEIAFYGEDSAGNKQQYGRFMAAITDPTSTSEDGRLAFGVVTAGTLANELELIGSALYPTTNDGLALGLASTGEFSDLFLAEGGVINWDNGDITLTQTNNELVLAGGNLDVGTNTLRISGDIDIDGTPATDDTWVGPSTNEFQAAATIAQWEAVYLNSSSQWALTDADAASTAGGVMVALATEAGTLNNALRVVLPGAFVRNDAWNWTVGGPIYLSTTAGALTQTAPSATDDVVRIVGYAVNADTVFWNPSNDWVTIV